LYRRKIIKNMEW